jgi:hypothetical protein
MKATFFVLVFATITFTVHAQTIEMEKTFGGHVYSQNGDKLSPKEVQNMMQPQSMEQKLMKKARANSTLASILGGVGGALIGFPLGTAIGGGEPEWWLAGIGAGFIGVAIPISISANKKAKQAVESYNTSLEETSFHKYQPEMHFVANGNGLGLSLRF